MPEYVEVLREIPFPTRQTNTDRDLGGSYFAKFSVRARVGGKSSGIMAVGFEFGETVDLEPGTYEFSVDGKSSRHFTYGTLSAPGKALFVRLSL